MDIKKKLETAKTKIKNHAPDVIVAASVAVTAVCVVAAVRMKNELEEFMNSSCGYPKDDPHLVTNKVIDDLLKDGKPQIFESPSSFDIEIQMKETPAED